MIDEGSSTERLQYIFHMGVPSSVVCARWRWRSGREGASPRQRGITRKQGSFIVALARSTRRRRRALLRVVGVEGGAGAGPEDGLWIEAFPLDEVTFRGVLQLKANISHRENVQTDKAEGRARRSSFALGVRQAFMYYGVSIAQTVVEFGVFAFT